MRQIVVDFIQQMAAEVVSETPFDDYETNLKHKLNEKRFQELVALIQRNPEITKEYVESAVQPIRDDIEEIREEVNQGIEDIKDLLTRKPKSKRNALPLRDPVRKDLFPFFFMNAGTTFRYQKDLKQAQLRIAYTILYHVGLRINEIRKLTEKDIRDAIAASQLNIIHFKTHQSHIHVLSKRAVKDLKNLEGELQIVFDIYQYKYLFGKDKPITAKSLIRTINQDLKHTSRLADLPYNIKSHSFRINVISNLLKHTTVQNAADIIGHNDIRSTLSYKRYTLSRTQIQDLLDKISEDSENDER